MYSRSSVDVEVDHGPAGKVSQRNIKNTGLFLLKKKKKKKGADTQETAKPRHLAERRSP